MVNRIPLPTSVRESPSLPKENNQVLDGEWEILFPKDQHPVWEKTHVPGNWAVQDQTHFNSTEAVYRKKFTPSKELQAALEKGEDLQFHFQGVDYKTEVFLNGELLGKHEGYFSPFSVPAAGLNPGKENILEVHVNAENPGYPIFKQAIKGVFGQHDARPAGSTLLNPLHPMAGKNDGNTGGIWNSVVLEAKGKIEILEPFVETKLSPDHQKADLSFHFSLFSKESEAKKVMLELEYGQEKVKGIRREVLVKPGDNQIAVDQVEKNPKLWWTWDKGEPNLYQFKVRVLDQGEVSDEKSGCFGIREIKYDPKHGIFTLNGKPVFQRGINYIPTQWLSSYPTQKYVTDLQKMKEANLNSVRVHAHVLPEEFYEKAAKEGFLVMAEFPLIWGALPDKKEAVKQYKEFVSQIRNFPCVWSYSAHNEPQPFPYTYFLDRALHKLSEKLDPSRVSFRSSSMREHNYAGWYFLKYTNVGLMNRLMPSSLITEYGAQAVPDSIHDFIPENSLWHPDEKVWKYHNFQSAQFKKYVGPYEAFQNVDQAARSSQEYQSDLLKYMTEYFRRNKGNPIVGLYPFMFSDPWPAVTWGVMDYKGEEKLGYQALKEAMAPLIVSLDWKTNRVSPGETYQVPVWLVSDLDKPVSGKMTYQLTRNGKKVFSEAFLSSAEENQSKKVGALKIPIPSDVNSNDKLEFHVFFQDDSGKVVAENGIKLKVGKNKSPIYEPVYVSAVPEGRDSAE
jgi:beta-mannosidase